MTGKETSDPEVALGPAVFIPVHAYAFPSTFRLKALGPVFDGSRAKVVLEKDELHASFEDGSTALAFDFGAVVFFGAKDNLRAELVGALAQKTGAAPPPRTEEFSVEVEPASPASRPDVRFDRVIVHELTWPVRSIVGLLLAQSASMDFYEDDISEILGETERILRSLRGQGYLLGRTRNLFRFIGRCIETKNEVIETLALFDKPEATWESESLDRLFVRLREMLEIGDRFRALQYRLGTIQDSVVLLANLSRGETTYRLELLVVLLILIELAVMVGQMLLARHA